MHSGSTTPAKPIGLTTSIGIASLILEGRSQCDDEDGLEGEHIQQPTINRITNSVTSEPSFPLHSLNLRLSYFAGGNSNHSHVATNQPGCSRPPTTSVADGTVQQIRRLREKLLLIRPAPGTSRDAVQQAIAVSSGSPSYYESSVDSDDDLDTVFPVPSGHAQKREGSNLLSTLRSLATNTCLNTTPRSFGRTQGLLSTVESWSPSVFLAQCSELPNPTTSQAVTVANPPSLEKKTTTCPNVGPHCEEFMKKIGLIKSAKAASEVTTKPMQIKSPPDDAYVEEHTCFDSKINCLRWKVQCIRMETIYAHADPICIEVYLGPENHVFLLEQWIIQRGERTNQMTMTLPSLCSAIRSQLHFSQISAWTEQLNSTTEPSANRNNPRVTKMPTDSPHISKYKLDILYRIRPFDNTSSFSEKPSIHNFPDTIVSEGQVVKVCLKSLPRQMTIPTLNARAPQNVVSPGHCSMASSSTVSSFRAVVNNRIQYPCTETGKHRCTSDEDPSESEANSHVPENGAQHLTHRNRQLEKYRRRLQKRDQKNKKETDSIAVEISNGSDSVNGSEATIINSIRPPLYCSSLSSRHGQSPVEMKTIGTQTVDHHYHGTNPNEGDDLSIAYPNCDFCGIEMQYVCWNCDNKLFTPSSPVRSSTNGSTRKSLDKANLLLQAIQRTPSNKQNAMMRNQNRQAAATSTTSTINSSSHSNRSFGGYPKYDSCDSPPFETTTFASRLNNVGVNQPPCDIPVGLDLSDCRLCKRQKTKHNYFGGNNTSNNNNHLLTNHNNNFSNNNNINNINISLSSVVGTAPNRPCDVEVDECRMSEDEDDVDVISPKDRIGQRAEATNYHRRTMSESLDVGNSLQADHSSELECRSAEHRRETVLSEMELKMYRRAYSEDVLTLGCDEINENRNPHRPNELFTSHQMELSVDTATPTSACQSTSNQTTCSPSSSLSAMSLNSSTKIPVECHYVRSIPKVNLSRVFNSTPQGVQSTDDCHPLSNPFSFEHLLPGQGTAETHIGLVIASPSTEFIPVHKSNSAPSFPVPHMLSPRFLKQSAIQKRRSRHLSDRSSERSSIGSDEPFSDEELGCGLDNTYVATLSPFNGQRGIARKTFPKSYPFGKKALLGSIEESLLQRRFVPKSHVPGFKVLLSASGGFYPTQLTIPSATSFYELHGDSLNTPYMCEVRMPRKGYSIPRKGTVQATLLNPLGMVVRMFVVPYDFRDMPILHHTFMRQRVLSDNRVESGTQLSTAEQMKLLRYAIHLRFQTSRSGRLSLHSDIRMVISRRTDCDTAAAHTKGVLEQPSELRTVTVMPDSPKYSLRLDKL